MRKSNFLDVAKVLATLLVVLGHILRMYTGEGLFVPNSENEYFALICYCIYGFHMPLFFMISGGCFLS